MKPSVIHPILFYVTISNAYSAASYKYRIQNSELSVVDDDAYMSMEKVSITENSKLNIKFYYECHCPYSRKFVSDHFKRTVEKLHKYLNIETYPYGNAKTYLYSDGEIEFECQHGSKECYGNKLHACALNTINNYTTALLYNSCMMERFQDAKGSDDRAADKCGYYMGIDSRPIKACAKGEMGTELLMYYGQESKKADIHSVPYVMINAARYEGVSGDFMQDVCAYFSDPPSACYHIEYY